MKQEYFEGLRDINALVTVYMETVMPFTSVTAAAR